MKLAGNLFVKVFIAFWLVTSAILGSWMFSAAYFDERPMGPAAQGAQQPGPPHRQTLRLIYDIQNLELTELQPVLESAQRRLQLRIYLLDSTGNDLFARDVPEYVYRASTRLESGRRRAVSSGPNGRIAAHSVYRGDTGPLRAVIEFDRPRGALLRVLGTNPELRLLLAVLVSGLVCFALSRLMTNRLQQLQLTARRIAGGDLSARMPVRARGRDETDDLARDLNAMAQELQSRIQAQRQLLGDVSHELRSPLARLRIALALAEKDPQSSDRHLTRIEDEAQRLEELIAQLLSSQAGNAELDAHIDLVALLRNLCEDTAFEGSGSQKNVSFTSDCAEAIVASSGDLLRKCFENVLRNAIAHTADGTTVAVNLVRDDCNFVIDIEDRGPGLPAEELARVFDAFYRTDSARSRETGGYGLGLSIARRAAQHHRGTIAASNTGSGLRITLILPIGDG